MAATHAQFGALLYQLRLGAGLTQERLADRAGIAVATIAALERGRRSTPYPHTVDRLADALGLSDAQRASLLSAAERGPRAPVTQAPTREQNHRQTTAGGPDLPLPLTPLIGRAREVARLRALLQAAGSRLVTVTGVGGVGKTRLALQVATDLRGWLADGVRLVGLASVEDSALVAQTVADGLGVRPALGSTPTEALVQFLRSKSLLLVLDNCEQVATGCAEVADTLLSRCLDVRLLATSRVPLQLTGEHQFLLPPLAAPEWDETGSLEAIAAYPSVQLFVARAQAVEPSFELMTRTAPAVAQICARLAGIPLALELAAARVRVLTVEQIVERLDDALRLLVQGSALAPTRQQTLRATLEWSHALLAPAKRVVLRRAAVFVGGWDVAAAEAVCGPAEAGMEVLDALDQLVMRAWVVAEAIGGTRRFRLLEPLRQYAAGQLAASDEQAVVQRRHACYFLDLAERASAKLTGPQQVAWLRRLDHEPDNLRAALQWAEREGERDVLLRLAVALAPYWEVRGALSEGRAWLDRGLAVPVDAAPERAWQRRRAHLALGRLALWQADTAAAEHHLRACLAQASQANNNNNNDDRQSQADALTWLGTLRRRQGAFGEAVLLLERSRPLHEALGDGWGAAWALFNLGHVAFNTGDLANAAPLLEASLERFEALADARHIGVSRTILGSVLARLGERERPSRLLRQGLAGLLEVGDRTYLFACLRNLAWVTAQAGQPARAARLLGAAEALGEALGARLAAVNQAMEGAVLEVLQEQLGETALAEARAAGRQMRMADLLAEAEAEAEAEAAPAVHARDQAGEALTAREQEVMELLRLGRSDRQIATALGITVRTASVHVGHILAKRGLRSRWQLADPAGVGSRA